VKRFPILLVVALAGCASAPANNLTFEQRMQVLQYMQNNRAPVYQLPPPPNLTMPQQKQINLYCTPAQPGTAYCTGQ
jgi:hypothetical protein